MSMDGGALLGGTSGADVTARRVQSILRVAAAHRTGISVASLADLLPAEGPPSGDAMAEWLRSHPGLGTVVGQTAFPASLLRSPTDLEDRRIRGQAYWLRAVGLSAGPLAPVVPLLRTLAVTGSTAYGEPEAGDDLDFLAVTRRDALWVFLAYTYLRLRLMPRSPLESASPCFNYILDETAAQREYVESRGLLFAREALTARPVLGESYYRGLVRSAGWMRGELPRLYARWDATPVEPSAPSRRTPRPVRWLNAVLFPLLATYLQIQGLIRNRRLRVSGRSDRAFRTRTTYRRLDFATARFERLRQAHEEVPRASGASR